MRSFVRAATVAVLAVPLLTVALLAAPGEAGAASSLPSDAATGATGSTGPIGTTYAAAAAQRLVARAGFVATGSGPRLAPQVFSTVAVLAVPAGPARRQVLAAGLLTAVPGRIALSVRAWCGPREAGPTTAERAWSDVLVIGQNPVPGTSSVAVASRRLDGRAVVDVPDGAAGVCVLQVSPRTESTRTSWLRVLSGRLTLLAPTRVVTRGAQRPAVLVGATTSPGSSSSALPERLVAAAPRTALPAGTRAVRALGDLETTTCALGYHLCGRGRAPTSVVQARLRVVTYDRSGRVCAGVDGPAVRTTITPAVHHVKVLVPAVAGPAACSDGPAASVSAVMVVRLVSGNAVEVEPTLEGGRVQTHVWVEALT